ncbi:hypothetical protein [Planobispora longispora]|nr:hypothetical protein [Planobispora longispora]
MAAALVPLAVLTACGQAPKAEVATAGSTASSTGPSASPSASAQEDGVKYAQCMRENGIDMPDPEPGGERVKIAGKVDKNKFDKAHKACQKYAPKAMRGPVDDPRARDALLAFARCMRENGIDMADPDFSGGGGGVKIGGPELNPDSPEFKKAHKACEKLLPGRPAERS